MLHNDIAERVDDEDVNEGDNEVLCKSNPKETLSMARWWNK